MTNQEQPSLDSWDDFSGSWLKAEHFKKFPDDTFVAYVKSGTDDEGNGILILDLQYAGRKWKKQLNKTDIKTLKELGIKSPNELKNKSITWEKVKVFDPNKKKHVESISVSGIK
jgi:hypothetical protein